VIVNVDGFPLSYETFDGNRADVTTLETVMRMIERKYGQARRVWVFDRGIGSDADVGVTGVVELKQNSASYQAP
jgi:transposase